jgi:hypothetical protein
MNNTFKLNTREAVITNTPSFKMTVKINDMLRPADLKSVYFIREEFNDKGERINDSTYEFFLNPEEMKTIANLMYNV